jgi:hypothetical protein
MYRRIGNLIPLDYTIDVGQIVFGGQVFDQRRTLGGAVQHLNDSGDQKQTDDESSAWLLRRRRHGAAAAGRYIHSHTQTRSIDPYCRPAII